MNTPLPNPICQCWEAKLCPNIDGSGGGGGWGEEEEKADTVQMVLSMTVFFPASRKRGLASQRQFQKTFGPFPGVLKPVLWHPGCKMVTISWKEDSFFSAQGGTRSVQVRKDRRLYEKRICRAQRAKKGVFLLSFHSKPQFGTLDSFPAFFWAFVGLTWLVLVPKVRETSACDW